MLFLQAAGSDFSKAHEFADAVAQAIRVPGGRPDPEKIAERVESAGFNSPEHLLVAMAVHATLSSPVIDLEWLASAASRIGDEALLLEAAGVAFAFNTVNRIADARRVRLEFRFLRELKPIQGWLERRLASLAGIVYDLSHKYQSRHSPAELRDRVGALFDRLDVPAVPEVFNWLSRSPVVLEGVLEMIEVNVMRAGIRFELLKEAAAIAVASRAMPDSGLRRAADQWLSRDSLPDAETLLSLAAPSGGGSDSELVSAYRRYSWRVANTAYAITDEQVRRLSSLGLSNEEMLDLTLAVAVFSALAII